MAPFLDRTKHVPNQTLILEMEKASAEENERLTKQKKVPDRMNVNEIKVAGMDTLIKQMSSMNEELKTLKADIKNVKDAKRGTNNKGSWKRSACQNCISNDIKPCTHCWKCGTSGHLSRNCQKPKGN